MLETVVKQNASRLHLAVGFRPLVEMPRQFRHAGRLPMELFGEESWSLGVRELSTDLLNAEDMIRLVDELASKEDLKECDERGGTSFEFKYGTEFPFHARLTKQGKNYSLSIMPIKFAKKF